MDENKHFHTLEESILLLQKEAKYMPISVGEILHLLSGKGRALILILLSLPFCQPIQIPGLSTPFGLVIVFIGLRMAFSKHIWLPERLLHQTISAETLQKITDKALVLSRKIKRWLHPRLSWICLSTPMQIINGMIICLLGLILALPLPIPLSNLAAAWSILLIALGILEDDGVFVLSGYLVCLLTIVFLTVMTLSIKHIFWV